MPQLGYIVRVLVASPSDVQDERDAIKEVIFNWNATHSKTRAIIVEPVMWESHSTPLQGQRPQGTLNKQLSHCDFLVAVFWTRMGTDTGFAVSGTAEEIQEFLTANKPVLVYYSNCEVQPKFLDYEQMQKLDAYKKEHKDKGVQHTYSNIASFREKLNQDITSVINDLDLPHPTPFVIEKSSPVRDKNQQFLEQIESFVRQVSAKWKAEKASQNGDVADARAIMEQVADQLISYLSKPNFCDDKQRESLTNLLTQSKQVAKQTIYIGGLGESIQAFWSNGDSILKELEAFYEQVKKKELLKSVPLLLTADVAYKKESILHGNRQYVFNMRIKGHNRTKTKINDYRMIVSIPKTLLLNNQFGDRLGRRLPERETASSAVFEFPNSKENGATLYPEDNETLGQISCILHRENINDPALKQSSIGVDFSAENSGKINCNFAVADLNPYGLQDVAVEQLHYETVYSLPAANPKYS